ncbi:hypothetical protein EJ06DRAFT_582901 [Trichodelitschia bisporula]|uniref:Uncharacterized protein n=1 Tax=Trichodelitschia bisporula TaxID=703511 RepID=A0A6G1HUG4_9PEZI|nr:hypothetical protein EJ06DRAFT_582901 [Trichodelitschia bisporula]
MPSVLSFLALASAASAAAVPMAHIEPRQIAGLSGGLGALAGLFGFGKGSAAKPATVSALPPLLIPTAKREIIRWGPYTLPAANAKHTGFSLDPGGTPISGQLAGLCSDCYFLSGSTYVTYANGSRADIASGVYNHHVFVGGMGIQALNPFGCTPGAKPTVTKDGVPITLPADNGIMGMLGMFGAKGGAAPAAMAGGHSHGARSVEQAKPPKSGGFGQIFGSGDDGVAMTYASRDQSLLKAGLYIPPNVTVMHTTELVNYKNESQVVYITADVEYVPGKPEGYKDASSGAMSATGCAGVGYMPPANAKSTMTSPPYIVKMDGWIYNIHAHLHDGGINVRVLKNGQEVCDSKAVYGGKGSTTVVGGKEWATIQDYEFCYKPIEIKVGDKVQLESNYDLVAHPLRPGAQDHSMGAEAMGMVGYAFAAK